MGSSKSDSRRNQKGSTLVEYALLCSLLAITCIASLQTLGIEINSEFDAITRSMSGSFDSLEVAGSCSGSSGHCGG